MPPLTAFLIDLLASRLPSADPGKLAAKYQIREQDAAGYLRLHRGW